MSIPSSIIADVRNRGPFKRAVLLRGSSMRFLETSLAILAIATAVLLGQVR